MHVEKLSVLAQIFYFLIKNTCMQRRMIFGTGYGAPEKILGTTPSFKRELMDRTNLVPKANFVDTFRGMGTSLGNEKICY